jgi:hypothetical protein
MMEILEYIVITATTILIMAIGYGMAKIKK